ncbi:MAG: DUF2461 domain-containing protein [bacterium]
MKTLPPDNLQFFPPFEGFPIQGIRFLKKLKQNNNRTWFEQHKAEYEEQVKLPIQSLVAALQPIVEKFAPEYDLNPRKALFRIYRDVRFSKDKTPYKIHAAAHFVIRGKAKGTEGSGFYLHIEPGNVFLGAGIYMPTAEKLKRIRKAIEEQPKEFLAIVKSRSFERTFTKLEGEKGKRPPQGYQQDHPMLEWLKYKQFYVWLEWPEKECYDPGFVKKVAQIYKEATPLVRFLNAAMFEVIPDE